jgi:glutaredoxin 3
MSFSEPLILYVVPNCPLCQEVRDWLGEAAVDYVERDVANDYSALRRMYKLTRQGLVPVIEKDGNAVVRPDRETFDRLLNA